MAKYIITTDGDQQGWMGAFNRFNNSNYKIGQEIKGKYAEEVMQEIYKFNNEYAHGQAVELIEVPE
ncbi:hypothetical protein [uncultured Vagococcus sp.]|uniref:hypothetical protein n=1 Tax=uncultured Vagococcus sp. TaxID=189676 RepID=UPI0028D1B32F|nr:hypothetical protein [uncultured Vagococcus sp.]